MLTNVEVEPWKRLAPKAGAEDAVAPNAGVDDAPKAGVLWPNVLPKGLLCGWLLPKAGALAPKAGVLDPNSPPEEDAPPKLNAIPPGGSRVKPQCDVELISPFAYACCSLIAVWRSGPHMAHHDKQGARYVRPRTSSLMYAEHNGTSFAPVDRTCTIPATFGSCQDVPDCHD